MGKAGILLEEDRVELIDGKIVVMPPVGDHHEFGTDWLTMLLAPVLVGRAMVRIQGSIRLHSRSAPEPDVAVLRMRPLTDIRPYFPDDIYFVIEVDDTSLAYDSGAKLARYAAAGISEVWVANLRIREVTVYADPSGSEYGTVNAYRPGDSISPSAFPDVVLAIDEFMPPATGGNDAR
jgi:Uma2 family endonuclease